MRKLAVVATVVAGLAAPELYSRDAGAQESGSLRFEKTVPYQLDKPIDLGATVGPVRVSQVRFSKGGSGPRETIMGRIRGGSPETHTNLRAGFDTENPKADEWVVTYTVDFLDAKGKLIDRASGSEGFEGEADVYHLDHSTLTYVVPMIAKVKIQLEAKYD